MAQVCELTGTRPVAGNKVSHSNIKTRTRWIPNLKEKKFFVPELSQSVTLKLTTRAIRTIDKLGGISPAILKAKDDKVSARVAKLKREIKKRQH